MASLPFHPGRPSPAYGAFLQVSRLARAFRSKGGRHGPTFIWRCWGLLCGRFSGAHLRPGAEGEAVARHRICSLHRELSLIGREVLHHLLSKFGSINWRERRVGRFIPCMGSRSCGSGGFWGFWKGIGHKLPPTGSTEGPPLHFRGHT